MLLSGAAGARCPFPKGERLRLYRTPGPDPEGGDLLLDPRHRATAHVPPPLLQIIEAETSITRES